MTTALVLMALLAGCIERKTPDTGLLPSNDQDGDGYDASLDCDDGDPAVNPGATEACNGVDDNCDAQVDEGLDSTFYADADGDGWGSLTNSTTACEAPEGYVPEAGDCNDSDPLKFPGAEEICNATDDDCDGDRDEDVTGVYYADDDGDRFGDPYDPRRECRAPPGFVEDNTDCDDTDAAIYPGAPEVCNGEDDDCDGTHDEEVFLVWYPDADGDGYGDPDSIRASCEPLEGYAAEGTDCDDTQALVNPDAAEICNGRDEDCDGTVDEDVRLTFHADADGDGYGDPATPFESCTALPGFVANSTDCDDTSASVSPYAPELCNGLDDNCDGGIDEGVVPTWYADADADGYGAHGTGVDACEAPSGYVSDPTDCDDTSPTTRPGAAETCNDRDDDCDGETDEGTLSTWHPDRDGDGWGSADTAVELCEAPGGWVGDGTDCDDGDPSTWPGAPDPDGDGVDRDCDGADAPIPCPCHEGDLEILTAADGEAFCASACSVCGSLTLGPGLEDLSSLACLTGVTGDLVVEGESLLSASLPRLKTVEGHLTLSEVPNLGSLDLSLLESVGGTLSFRDSWISLAVELPALLSVGELNLSGSRGWVDLSVPVLARAGGLFVGDGEVTLDAPSLTSVEGGLGIGFLTSLSLPALEEAGYVEIYMDRVERLDLPALATVGFVNLFVVAGLTSLDLPSLATVGSSLSFLGCEDLVQVSLPRVERVTDLTVQSNPVFQDLLAPSLTSVEGDAVLQALGAWEDTEDLSGLRTVEGDLFLYDNGVLVDLGGLMGLERVGGDLTIVENPSLPTSEAEALAAAIDAIGGTVTISGNAP